MIETSRIARRRERRRTVAALVVSLLIHLLLVAIAVIVLALGGRLSPPPPEEDDDPVEIIILPPEPEREATRGFVDGSQGTAADAAPEDAPFESDRDLAAASEQPADGELPIPTQDGIELDALAMRDQELSLGPLDAPADPSPDSPARQPAEPQPEARPQPESPEPPDRPDESEAEREKPEATPEATPYEAEIALLDPTPRRPAPRPEPEIRRPEEPARPSTPQTPGYQPQTRTTRLRGGISNRGRSSVEAVATPLGRYRKMLSDAIGSRWYYYVNNMIDLVTIGTVELRFTVRADGRVENVQVVSNTSNESLASCSVRSIIEAEIPPIPPEIAETLEGGSLEVDYSFTIIGR